MTSYYIEIVFLLFLFLILNLLHSEFLAWKKLLLHIDHANFLRLLLFSLSPAMLTRWKLVAIYLPGLSLNIIIGNLRRYFQKTVG